MESSSVNVAVARVGSQCEQGQYELPVEPLDGLKASAGV